MKRYIPDIDSLPAWPGAADTLENKFQRLIYETKPAEIEIPPQAFQRLKRELQTKYRELTPHRSIPRALNIDGVAITKGKRGKR